MDNIQFNLPSTLTNIADTAAKYLPSKRYPGIDKLPERRDQILESRRKYIDNFLLQVCIESQKRILSFPDELKNYILECRKDSKPLILQDFIIRFIRIAKFNSANTFMYAALAETHSFLTYLGSQPFTINSCNQELSTEPDLALLEDVVYVWLSQVKVGEGNHKIAESTKDGYLMRTGLDGEEKSCPATGLHLMILFCKIAYDYIILKKLSRVLCEEKDYQHVES